jgi:hypothetical protein
MPEGAQSISIGEKDVVTSNGSSYEIDRIDRISQD